MGKAAAVRVTGKFSLQCDWCAVAKECPAEQRADCKARSFFTMFDEFPYVCPDHEPMWWQGIEGCRP